MQEKISAIKRKIKKSDVIERILGLNLVVFILVHLFGFFVNTNGSNTNWLVSLLSLAPNIRGFLQLPLSVITYGFIHVNFIHILFNSIAIYYIGYLSLDYFGVKKFLNIYILGILTGGIVCLFTYNYFISNSSTFIVGASAGITSVFIAIATYMPHYQLKIRFIGFVKLWILACLWLAFDIVQLSGSNIGGHMAHLGGALFGFLYIYMTNSDFKFNIVKKKNPFSDIYINKDKKVNFNKNKSVENQDKINLILEKISKSGYDSLSAKEKEFLFKQK